MMFHYKIIEKLKRIFERNIFFPPYQVDPIFAELVKQWENLNMGGGYMFCTGKGGNDCDAILL